MVQVVAMTSFHSQLDSLSLPQSRKRIDRGVDLAGLARIPFDWALEENHPSSLGAEFRRLRFAQPASWLLRPILPGLQWT